MNNLSSSVLRRQFELSEALRLKGLDYDSDFLKRLIDPFIEGIEVTQGIQYYQSSRHLTDINDRGDDNSVRLVANKPAWVRIYLHSGILGGSQAVTGEVVVQRRQTPLLAVWSTIATLLPQAPGTVQTQSNPNYVLERSTIASTLNFIIPEGAMWGTIRLISNVWKQGGNAASPIDTDETVLDVTLKQTLRLRGVLISYNGPDPTVNSVNPPNISLPAPTVADLQATAAWTLTTNPVESQGIFSSAGNLQWSMPLTGMATVPGGCSTQWIQLNAAVAQVRTNDGNRNDVIYYGLLPANTPIANVGGCESSGVSTGPNGQQVTMAHEVGHGAGLAHGPCSTPGDTNFPAYEPYDPLNTPTASLGEYGLDINNGMIHPPTEKDYMSYCGPVWISLYHHARLIDNNRLNPQTVGTGKFRLPELVDPYLWPWEYIPDPPPWERHPGDLRMKAEKVISIIGVMNEEREMQVQSIMRVTALPAIADIQETSFVAQLISKEGKVVASAPVTRLNSHGSCCNHNNGAQHNDSEPFAFQALVSDANPGAALRIVRKDRSDGSDIEIWMRRAPEQEPRIGDFNVRVTEDNVLAEWDARGTSEQPLEFALQFSKDEGKSWNSLTVGIRDKRYNAQMSDLPSGIIIFRLLAHDGFFTSTVESTPVQVPARAPTVTILHPQEGPTLISGHPMRLWAAVTTTTRELINSDACIWILDGIEISRGLDAWTTAPEGGEHRCTLIVEDNTGRSEVNVTFTTIDPERIQASR
jgi:hypothetical protein